MCVTIYGCKITVSNSHKVKDYAKLRKNIETCKSFLYFFAQMMQKNAICHESGESAT